jgi:hypothetical protein
MIPVRETDTKTVTEVSKSQTVRLWDVFFVGPVLMWVAYKYRKQMTPLEQVIVGGIGAATIYYNGRNYLSNVGKLPKSS